MEALADKCTNIQELYLSWSVVTDWGMSFICQKCVHLTDINLAGCWQITDSFCATLGKCCPKLKTLNLSSTKVTFAGVVFVVENCKSLRLLDVRRCAIKKEQKECLAIYGLQSLLT